MNNSVILTGGLPERQLDDVCGGGVAHDGADRSGEGLEVVEFVHVFALLVKKIRGRNGENGEWLMVSMGLKLDPSMTVNPFVTYCATNLAI